MKSALNLMDLPVPFPCFLTLSRNKGPGRIRDGGENVLPESRKDLRRMGTPARRWRHKLSIMNHHLVPASLLAIVIG